LARPVIRTHGLLFATSTIAIDCFSENFKSDPLYKVKCDKKLTLARHRIMNTYRWRSSKKLMCAQ